MREIVFTLILVVLCLSSTQGWSGTENSSLTLSQFAKNLTPLNKESSKQDIIERQSEELLDQLILIRNKCSVGDVENLVTHMSSVLGLTTNLSARIKFSGGNSGIVDQIRNGIGGHIDSLLGQPGFGERDYTQTCDAFFRVSK